MLNTVVIGYVGENDARDVRIPLGDILHQWPGMMVTLLMKPVGSTDDEAYPVASSLEGNDLVWHVSAVDTISAGTTQGTIRLNNAEGKVVLNEPFTVIVSSNLRVGAKPPEQLEPWFDSFTQNAQAELEKISKATSEANEKADLANKAAEKADAAATRIDNMTVAVEMLNPSEAPSAEVEQTEFATNLLLKIPKSNLAYATFEVDDNMELLMHAPEDYGGIAFALNENGELEVAIQ